MASKVRNIYAGGNTARGYQHFFDSVLQDLEQIFVFTGATGIEITPLLKAAGEQMIANGFDIEWIHSPFAAGALDGVIVTECRTGIVDGRYPRLIRPKAPAIVETYIDLNTALHVETLKPYKEKITALHDSLAKNCQTAYDTFAKALRVHDEWEHFYISNMDYGKANDVTKELIQLFFKDQKLAKNSHVRHMFFGAATPVGPVDHIQNLTMDMEKRYFIKGRPGSGKSTMLKKLVAEAEERGFDAEVYHCGFDPNSLDMIIFPEQSIAIFDSTAPHEYFPDRSTDEIVDMYERTITPGTDEAYAVELAEIKERYTSKMKEATAHLASAKLQRDELAEIYELSTNSVKIEEIKIEILTTLTAMRS